jgi:hypothetical protein
MGLAVSEAHHIQAEGRGIAVGRFGIVHLRVAAMDEHADDLLGIVRVPPASESQGLGGHSFYYTWWRVRTRGYVIGYLVSKYFLGIIVATVPKYVTILCCTTVPISRFASGAVNLYSVVNHLSMSLFAIRNPKSMLL